MEAKTFFGYVFVFIMIFLTVTMSVALEDADYEVDCGHHGYSACNQNEVGDVVDDIQEYDNDQTSVINKNVKKIKKNVRKIRRNTHEIKEFEWYVLDNEDDYLAQDGSGISLRAVKNWFFKLIYPMIQQDIVDAEERVNERIDSIECVGSENPLVCELLLKAERTGEPQSRGDTFCYVEPLWCVTDNI